MKLINRIIDKYKKMSLPIKASLWFVICSVLQKGISVITMPIFTRLLTPYEYGVYSVFQSWYSIIVVFTTLNLYAGVFNNGMIKYEKDRDGFQASLIGLSLTITLVLSVIYLVSMDFWNRIFDMSTPLVIAIFIESFFSVGLSFWSSHQRFEYKYRALVIVTLISAVLAPILGIIGVLLTTTYKAEARIFTYVFVQVIFGGALCLNSFIKGKRFFNKEYWKFALHFNIPLIPHYLAQNILNQADRIMISQMVGIDKAAIYSVAYSAAMLMTIFTSSINNSFIPWTYKSIRDKKYIELRNLSKALLILIGGISMTVVLFAPELIAILAGREYAEAVNVIPPVAGTVYFMFLYPLFGNIEFYFEKTRFIMVASSLVAVLNIGLNYIGISVFGYIAAGYTTLICYVILSIAHYFFMRKVCTQNNVPLSIYDTKFLITFSLLYLIVILIMSVTFTHTLIRYGIILMLFLILIYKRKNILNILKCKIKG